MVTELPDSVIDAVRSITLRGYTTTLTGDDVVSLAAALAPYLASHDGVVLQVAARRGGTDEVERALKESHDRGYELGLEDSSTRAYNDAYDDAYDAARAAASADALHEGGRGERS